MRIWYTWSDQRPSHSRWRTWVWMSGRIIELCGHGVPFNFINGYCPSSDSHFLLWNNYLLCSLNGTPYSLHCQEKVLSSTVKPSFQLPPGINSRPCTRLLIRNSCVTLQVLVDQVWLLYHFFAIAWRIPHYRKKILHDTSRKYPLKIGRVRFPPEQLSSGSMQNGNWGSNSEPSSWLISRPRPRHSVIYDISMS